MIFNSTAILNNIENQQSITVETSITDKGLPTFEIFGLISRSVDESRQRITTAFESLGIPFPLKRISVNLSPAEILKDGTHFDLSIAATILSYTHNLKITSEEVFIGELSFDGSVQSVKNIFYLTLVAKELGYKKIYIPSRDLNKIKILLGIEILGVNSLMDLINTQNLSTRSLSDEVAAEEIYNPVITKIIGNDYAKRVLALSIAGKHNLMLEGFPGVGKSMLAKAAADLMPDLNQENLLYSEKIFSYLGIKRDSNNIKRPPFRNPHSSSSYAAIFGSSGNKIYPGEVVLANNGILFLDELPEFNRLVIEGLRSPLEDKVISIARAKGKVTFPCNFLLIATSNPCRCGYFNHRKIPCKCKPNEIIKYQNKISGPIKDRIDIKLNINSYIGNKTTHEENTYSYSEYLNIKEKVKEVCSELEILKRVENSIKKEGESTSNLFTHYNINKEVSNMLCSVQEKYSVSPRKVLKILNLSRTVSYYNGCHTISLNDFMEAVNLSGLNL